MFSILRGLFLSALCATVGYAQSPTTMTIEVHALANESATSYVATLALTQWADSADKAERLARERKTKFTRDLQALGVEGIYAEFVALRPAFAPVYGKAEKKGGAAPKVGEQLRGFEYRANLRISYTNGDLLSAILVAATRQEIYDLIDVEYRHQNGEAVFANLRQRAFDYFRIYLPQLEDYGINAIDWQRYTQETRQVFAPDQRQSLQTSAYLQTPTTIVAEKGGMPVVERRALEDKSYRRLPAETFQIVVNPEVVEPCMQFVYTMRFQFVIPVEGQKIEYKNEIIMPPAPTPKPQPVYTPPLAPQD